VIKRLIPLLAVLTAACESHTTGLTGCAPGVSSMVASSARGVSLRAHGLARSSVAQTDVSNMSVGDVRVLAPVDMPSGITFSQGTT